MGKRFVSKRSIQLNHTINISKNSGTIKLIRIIEHPKGDNRKGTKLPIEILKNKIRDATI